MTKLTVIGYEEGRPDNILIYTVNVADPDDQDEVTTAIYHERQADLRHEDTQAGAMIALFAFEGYLTPKYDWRD